MYNLLLIKMNFNGIFLINLFNGPMSSPSSSLSCHLISDLNHLLDKFLSGLLTLLGHDSLDGLLGADVLSNLLRWSRTIVGDSIDLRKGSLITTNTINKSEFESTVKSICSSE